MTFQNFRSKINRRQILIHFIGSWFLIQAFGILVYLTDVTLLKLLEVNQLTPESTLKIMGHMSGQDIAYYAILTSTAGFVGSIVAFIFSLFISIKNRWFWFNSFIVLIVINLFSYLNLLGWYILKNIFLIPGSLFSNQVIEFSVNGVYLLIIGIILLFSKKTNTFISNNSHSTFIKDISLATTELRQFIFKLNWRQIIIHFIATWFLTYAFQTLSLLHDPYILNVLKHNNEKELLQSISNNQVLANEIIKFDYVSDMSKFIAILIAFFISMLISIRKKWFWFNSIVILTSAYFLNSQHLLGWNFFKKIALLPGQVFKNPIVDYFTSGIILLMISFILFFLKEVNRFIEKGNIRNVPPKIHQEE